MGFTCGIVGLPNVGKSTLFNALTTAGIAAQNYPFCTIEPNVGNVPVPDPRLDKLAEIISPEKIIPTSMAFVDIAGLVAGASKGEGLGNQFLANIRETDAIAHVVRCFEDSEVIHVAGRISPLDDIEVIHTELALADLNTVEKALQKVIRKANVGEKAAKQEAAALEQLRAGLDAGKPVRSLELDDTAHTIARTYQLLTAKPMLYIANVKDVLTEADNARVEAVKNLAEAEGANVVVMSAQLEAEIIELPENERLLFLAEMGLSETGLSRVIRAGYDLLNLLTFFTAGPKEVRAWTVRRGAAAPEAAGRIHTDFEKGFIRAEVISYDDFIQYRGEHGAKDAGKWRLEGKDYIVSDGDVMHFRFNV